MQKYKKTLFNLLKRVYSYCYLLQEQVWEFSVLQCAHVQLDPQEQVFPQLHEQFVFSVIGVDYKI